MRWLDSISNTMEMNLNKLQEIVKDREGWYAAAHGAQRVGHNLATEQQKQQLFPEYHLNIFALTGMSTNMYFLQWLSSFCPAITISTPAFSLKFYCPLCSLLDHKCHNGHN